MSPMKMPTLKSSNKKKKESEENNSIDRSWMDEASDGLATPEDAVAQRKELAASLQAEAMQQETENMPPAGEFGDLDVESMTQEQIDVRNQQRQEYAESLPDISEFSAESAQDESTEGVVIAENATIEGTPSVSNPEDNPDVISTLGREDVSETVTQMATPEQEAQVVESFEQEAQIASDIEKQGDASITVKSGDNISRLIAQQLNNNPEYALLNDEEKTALKKEAYTQFANLLPEDLESIGIKSGDINKLAIGDTLDFSEMEWYGRGSDMPKEIPTIAATDKKKKFDTVEEDEQTNVASDPLEHSKPIPTMAEAVVPESMEESAEKSAWVNPDTGKKWSSSEHSKGESPQEMAEAKVPEFIKDNLPEDAAVAMSGGAKSVDEFMENSKEDIAIDDQVVQGLQDAYEQLSQAIESTGDTVVDGVEYTAKEASDLAEGLMEFIGFAKKEVKYGESESQTLGSVANLEK
ncbi:MAG: hypothetical protein U9Q12_02320 [Patescibacteria group bacterium]|nr:hypothetical protein [Patescibacteria group bacterium]